MDSHEREAVLTVCLMAAFADGDKGDAERAQVRSVAERLAGVEADGADGGVDLTRPLERVLLRRVTLPELAGVVTDEAHRRLAYEMAVVVCDADGVCNEKERAFLADLRRALALPGGDDAIAEADAIVGLDALASAEAQGEPATASTAAPAASDALPVPSPNAPADGAGAAAGADVDAMVVKYAVLTAALELLPQNLATLAILPLQTKMVYRVGRAHGHTLDRRSITEFLAVLGLGATSQVLENVARKFLGKLGKTLAGRTGKTAANWGTGPAVTFATTFALGRLAQAYCAAGRTLSPAQLQGQFGTLVEQGKAAFDRYRPQVEQQAATIKPTQLLSLIRGA